MKDLRKTAEEILDKNYQQSNDKEYSKECITNAMLEMYQLDRPKPIPFDANDPSTFPKEQNEYLVKVNGFWLVDRWSDMTFWFNYKDEEITHYAEILMPEK